ncbi:CGNR zinc finger domain-containing protein [Brevibacillus borstelensis]|uniref:CGNR zinc finger domain-containing protein n=1 Tax=Brevibacillus borstelensis TaxID=45462 RepID=UPI0030C3D0A9
MEWICLDFINSDCRNWRGSGQREDRLTKPEWWQYFANKWELQVPLPSDPKLLLALRELRQQMRNVVEAVAKGEPPDAGDLHGINQAIAAVPSYRRVVHQPDGFRVEEVVLGEGWDLVMGRIAASFAELLADADLRRLKICENRSCLWVYFDESRNRSSRWCDDKTCGNLMKVRRFRERQKNKGEGD